MKIWEILKKENLGKSVVGNNKVIYEIALGRRGDILLFKKENSVCEEFSQIEIMTLDFEFIQQPVTFEEVLNSDKKCKIEHEYLKQNWFNFANYDDIIAKTYIEDVHNGKYMYFKNIMYALSYRLNSEDFKKVIKEAKWYLEP